MDHQADEIDTIEVLRGRYLGDVCAAATYQKGAVRQMPDILQACYGIGRKSVEPMAGKEES